MNWVTWVVIIVLLGMLVMQLISGLVGFRGISMNQIMNVLQSGEKLKEVVIIDGDQIVQTTMEAGQYIQSNQVGRQVDGFVEILQRRSAAGTLNQWVARYPTPNLLTSLIYTGLLFLLLAVDFFVVMRTVSGGGSGSPFSLGKSKAKLTSKDMPGTTLADVVGADEAIEELQEVREFPVEPAKFQKLSAKTPKGVLLYGPPGVGRTFLTHAVTGEAGVSFFSTSGSGFVEMFVSVGASQARDLFKQVKEAAPAIVFVDGIDAVDCHRDADMGGGHDEREQILNQLLVEMDGLSVRDGVILVVATSHPSVFGPALLRPGCFDRQISMGAPDLIGRPHIFQMHAVNKPLTKDIDFDSVAHRTSGFSGVDLANVLNEAALLAAYSNLNEIGRAQLDEIINRVIAGPQRRTYLMNDHECLITAYHEGRHVLVAATMPGSDPVQKVTILPRGHALGYTMVIPDGDKYSHTRGELLDQMAYMMDDRATEEMIFHDPTTSAQSSIEKAMKMARAMVVQYDMSGRVGAIQLGGGNSELFMGTRKAQPLKDLSRVSAMIIGEEVAELINAAHQGACNVLVENREVLDELVRQLFTKETLNKAEVIGVFRDLKRHGKRPVWTGPELRIPFIIPSVEAPVFPDPPSQETPPGQITHHPLPSDPPGRWASPASEDRW